MFPNQCIHLLWSGLHLLPINMFVLNKTTISRTTILLYTRCTFQNYFKNFVAAQKPQKNPLLPDFFNSFCLLVSLVLLIVRDMLFPSTVRPSFAMVFLPPVTFLRFRESNDSITMLEEDLLCSLLRHFKSLTDVAFWSTTNSYSAAVLDISEMRLRLFCPSWVAVLLRKVLSSVVQLDHVSKVNKRDEKIQKWIPTHVHGKPPPRISEEEEQTKKRQQNKQHHSFASSVAHQICNSASRRADEFILERW